MSYLKVNAWIDTAPEMLGDAEKAFQDVFGAEDTEITEPYLDGFEFRYAGQRTDGLTIIDKCKLIISKSKIKNGNIDFQYDYDPWQFDDYYRLTFDRKRGRWIEKRGYVVYETEEVM